MRFEGEDLHKTLSFFSGKRSVRRLRRSSLCRRFLFDLRAQWNWGFQVTFSLFFLLVLCYCVLHVLRHFVHWNWCIKAMCSTVACCNSIVLCSSVCADRSGMAAPRLLEWVAWKLRMVLWQQIFFPILVLMIFLFEKILLKSASKSSFFRLGIEIRFWSCNLCSCCPDSIVFLQLSLCRSEWNGCVKVPR